MNYREPIPNQKGTHWMKLYHRKKKRRQQRKSL
jgi:hypothetical protein